MDLKFLTIKEYKVNLVVTAIRKITKEVIPLNFVLITTKMGKLFCWDIDESLQLRCDITNSMNNLKKNMFDD